VTRFITFERYSLETLEQKGSLIRKAVEFRNRERKKKELDSKKLKVESLKNHLIFLRKSGATYEGLRRYLQKNGVKYSITSIKRCYYEFDIEAYTIDALTEMEVGKLNVFLDELNSTYKKSVKRRVYSWSLYRPIKSEILALKDVAKLTFPEIVKFLKGEGHKKVKIAALKKQYYEWKRELNG
jgi:hypothetical protein